METCDEICTGSFTISTQQELDVITNCVEITGDLHFVETEFQDFSSIQKLRDIGGTLTISDNAILTSLEGLNIIRDVGGALILSNNPLLQI